MEDKSPSLEALYEKTEQYAKTSVELYKLKALGKLADVVSSIISNMAVITCVSISFLIFNIGLAIYIGELLGKTYYGFFIVSGFYALITLLVYIFRHQWIKTPVSNTIIEKSLKQTT